MCIRVFPAGMCVCGGGHQEPQGHLGCGSSRAAHFGFATFAVVLETGSFSHWSRANVRNRSVGFIFSMRSLRTHQRLRDNLEAPGTCLP